MLHEPVAVVLGARLLGSAAGNLRLTILAPHFENITCFWWRRSKAPMDDPYSDGYGFRNAEMTNQRNHVMLQLPRKKEAR